MKTIAVDLDDVLAASAQGFIDFSNKKWGTRLTIDDYSEHWAEMWKVDIEESEKRAKVIHTAGFQASYQVIDKSQEVLKKLSKKYKLVILTARNRLVEQTTLEWIELHFRGVFKEIHFAGIWDAGHDVLHALKLTKAEISKQIGADYLIDDHVKHCVGASEVGVKALLFGDYTSSRGVKLPKEITRVKNWQQVAEYFGV